MSGSDPMSRRGFLRLLLSTGLATVLAGTEGRRVLGAPRDQGIGGTGAAPPVDETDRGIGGTGVIGTIRKFGSIYVNDLRIAYPADAEVRIDGQPATQSDLKLGQVVAVDATGAADALSTRRILVNSEVVGPVERSGNTVLTVLGQVVSTETLERRDYAVGETVAVSGLRRNDGTIVASLIEARPGAPSLVAGPVMRSPDGGLTIGTLALDGVDPTLIGHRARLEGRQVGGRFVVRRGYADTSVFPRTVRKVSIESYVERRNGALALGSGFALADTRDIDIAEGRSVRAVLTTSLERDGRLTLENVRADGRTYRAQPGGGRPGGGGGGRGGGGGGGQGGRGTGEGRGDGGRGQGGPGGRDKGGRGAGGHDGHGGGRGADGRDGGRDGRGHGGAGHGGSRNGGPGHGGPGHGGGGRGGIDRGPGGRGGEGPFGRGGPGEGPGGFGGPGFRGPGGPDFRGPGGFGFRGHGGGGFRGPGGGGFRGPGGGGFRGGGGGGHGGGGRGRR